VTVAALFVDQRGFYATQPDVEPWDEERDARLYCGPHPVVAHPPCRRWGQLGVAAYARWGGEHNRPGNDGGCFASALASLRRWGGVLEHPAKSMAFAAHGIEAPRASGWLQVRANEWVCEVWQSAYGHRARKATWLIYVGETEPFALNWTRTPGTHQIGSPDRRGKARNKPTLSGRESSATPPMFGAALIALARKGGTSNA
jgi:hypothetical protein